MKYLAESQKVRVALGVHISRSISDDGWEFVEPEHINAWANAKLVLCDRIFDVADSKLRIVVDWNPALRRLKKNFSILKDLYSNKGTPSAWGISNQFSLKPCYVEFVFLPENLNTGNDRSFRYDCYVEYFLYDFFMIMNIASPGSCNLSGCKILRPRKIDETKIELSNTFFDIALLRSIDGKWPNIEFISLYSVIKWFYNTRSTQRLLPKNRMEKVLFSILHLSKSDISPMSIIWIFYALESLYDTKVGENYRYLISRIQLLLSPNASQLSYLKDNMRKLYDMRSSLVHGGFEVIHPMHNENIDNSIDERFANLIEAFDFGAHILLASIQEVIRRDCGEPIFTEVLLDKQNI